MTAKKMVNKGECKGKLLQRTFAVALKTGMVALCLIAFAFALDFLRRLCPDPNALQIVLIALASIVLMAVCAASTLWIAIPAVTEAKKIYANLPFTRINAGDLPAPDTLVRASTEPMQAQEAMLLRAATEGVETPPEQLVRASIGQE